MTADCDERRKEWTWRRQQEPLRHDTDRSTVSAQSRTAEAQFRADWPSPAMHLLPGWSWSGVVAFLSVLLLASLPYAAEAGKCIEPSRGSTAFCEINYQVYVSADTLANDTAYWFALDRAAESLTEEWDKNMGCSASVLSGEAWCKNFACAKYFQACTSFKDAPMPVCRQTCKDCFRTCTPDRPLLPPGIYNRNADKTWGDQYKQIKYDVWSKAYMCDADHRLVDGGNFFLWGWGTPCTGAGARLDGSVLTSLFVCSSLLLLQKFFLM